MKEKLKKISFGICPLIGGIILHFWPTLDRELFFLINRANTYLFDKAMVSITHLGDGVILFIFSLLIFKFYGWKRFLKSALILGITGGIAQIIKYLYPCPRPAAVLSGVHTLGTILRARSFPSGHAAASLVLAVYVGKVSPKIKKPVLAVAILVGISRIYIGAHFPSDVIFSWGLGYLIASLVD